jgi:type VI protein secretion system component Hcp
MTKEVSRCPDRSKSDSITLRGGVEERANVCRSIYKISRQTDVDGSTNQSEELMARLVDLEIITKDGKFDLDPVHTGVDDAAIFCRRFVMGGTAATNPKSGSPKGTREYEGITIEKPLNGASPALFQLFTGHVGFKAVFRIHQVKAGPTHEPGEVVLTVTIGGDDFLAWISSYKLVVQDVETRAENDPDEPYEVILFSFSHITYHKSGTDNAGAPTELMVEDSLLGVM